MRKKRLTPEQTAALNRTLRHLASELERRKAMREAREQAEKQSLYRLWLELADA